MAKVLAAVGFGDSEEGLRSYLTFAESKDVLRIALRIARRAGEQLSILSSGAL